MSSGDRNITVYVEINGKSYAVITFTNIYNNPYGHPSWDKTISITD